MEMPKSEPSFSSSAAGDAEGTAATPKKRGSKRGANDKRERILRAAIRVFARKGFYSTRVSEIAKAAGVADGTIYLYFKNKDDVLVSIFQDRISKLLALLEEEVPKASGAEAKLRVVVDVQLGVLEGSRDLAEVITVNLRQSSKLLRQYGAPLFGRYLEVIAKVIEQGQRDGEVRPDLNPRVLARALWGSLDALALGWALGGGDETQLREAAAEVIDTLWEGARTRGAND